MDYQHSDLTNKIIKCFYNVYNFLGYGFLEKVYENSFVFELKQNGLFVIQQMPIKVSYKEQPVGDYFADLVVANKIILELKAQEVLAPENEAQLLNYLKATEYEVGLLLNFGKKPEIKRKIFSNDLK
ncbi:MAG: GxxExxY protein [Candidatus Andersenbacteria bacterium]|nr:GxxExxY protein [Candidatus Andersenbacteria bacterium]